MAVVQEYISLHKPDILCFQELDSNLLGLIEPGLPAGLKRGGLSINESLPAKDGCGIFFNTDKFDLLESRSERFCNVVDKHLGQLSEAARNDASAVSLTRALYRELREKLNMIVMARLQDRSSGNRFVVCSSHLYWDPVYPDIKLLQAYLLAQEALEYARDSSGLVIGADLNSIPSTSGVYELLMGSGFVDVSHPDHPVSLRTNKTNPRLTGIPVDAVPSLSLTTPFISAIKSVNGQEPVYTNYTASFKGCLDYILLGGKIEAISSLPLPEESELAFETALPNSKWPSDHLPLVVDLKLS